jgi:DNA mismatch endonuclease (patch repair protein)
VRGRGRYRWGAAVRSSGTAPERRVRAALEWLNVAYRANASELPGSPDVVFDEARKALFVHGCFWHVHPGCAWRDRPVPRKLFWQEKLARNVLRDERSVSALEALGWEVAVVWECETRDSGALRARLSAFLGDAASAA